MRQHLQEFFASLDAIAEANAEILDGLRPGGTAVLNGDDPRVRRIGERFAGRVVWFGHDRRFDVSAESWRGTAFGMRFDLRIGERAIDVALPLAGPHFVEDFLAAAAAAHVLGMAPDSSAEAATRMLPARHRGELRRLGDGVIVLDDCYNSSPAALEAAVVALGLVPGLRRIAVVGDMLELGVTRPELHRAAGRGLAGRVYVVVGIGPDPVYKLIEVTGTSTTSIEEAIAKDIKRAHKTIKNLCWFQVIETRGNIENDKIAHWQVTIKVGFALND